MVTETIVDHSSVKTVPKYHVLLDSNEKHSEINKFSTWRILR